MIGIHQPKTEVYKFHVHTECKALEDVSQTYWPPDSLQRNPRMQNHKSDSNSSEYLHCIMHVHGCLPQQIKTLTTVNHSRKTSEWILLVRGIPDWINQSYQPSVCCGIRWKTTETTFGHMQPPQRNSPKPGILRFFFFAFAFVCLKITEQFKNICEPVPFYFHQKCQTL